MTGASPLSQREAVSGMFSEALAEVELAEREARRRREEREEERQLQETYQVSFYPFTNKFQN